MTNESAVILQHEVETTPGTILEWLEDRRVSYEISLVREINDFNRLLTKDLIIICGGSMNVHEVQEHPWLREEKKFIKTCLNENKKILAICLGAQLVAEQLGARVYSMEKSEVGWGQIEDFKLYNCNIKSTNFFHFHAYQFGLPRNAVRIGSTMNCKNQGFTYGNTLALQFHPEVDLNWLKLNKLDISNAQTHTRMNMQNIFDSNYIQQAKKIFFEILDAWNATNLRQPLAKSLEGL